MFLYHKNIRNLLVQFKMPVPIYLEQNEDGIRKKKQ